MIFIKPRTCSSTVKAERWAKSSISVIFTSRSDHPNNPTTDNVRCDFKDQDQIMIWSWNWYKSKFLNNTSDITRKNSGMHVYNNSKIVTIANTELTLDVNFL